MILTSTQRAFLASVVELNERFNVVRAGKTQIALAHSFWSETEISQATKVQEEWDLPASLVPFYGDWHTVLCLNLLSGAVELLNDQRQVLFTWPSVSEFVNCLVFESESPIDTSGIIEGESWLDF